MTVRRDRFGLGNGEENLPWWEVCLWLWELLAPRLALLDDLLLWLCLVAAVGGGSCYAVVVGLGLEALIVGVVVFGTVDLGWVHAIEEGRV